MMRIYLTNLGKYNEGELVGEWVDLPIEKENLQEVFKRIGIDGKQYEEYFITDYECDFYEIEANSPDEAEQILRERIANGKEFAPEQCQDSWCDVQELKGV